MSLAKRHQTMYSRKQYATISSDMIPSSTSAFHFTHKNRSYYLPFYISPNYLPLEVRSHYSIWLYVELFGHLLTIFSIFLFVYVAWKTNAFHINMKILNTYACLILGGTNLLTRLFFILLELGTVRSADVVAYIVPVHLIKYCAWLGIYHYILYTTAERYAALRYAEDYETNNRLWISVSLVFINTIVTVPIAFLLINDILNGAIYSAGVCLASNLSCWVFSRIKTRGLTNQAKLVAFTNTSQYSVSHRWQLKENIHLAKDIRFYVIGLAAMITFYLPLFFVPPLIFGGDTKWRQWLELSKACFQLICAYGFFIAYMFCTLSIGRHVDFIRMKLGLKTNITIEPLPGTTQSHEEYFNTLSGWWTT